MMLIIDQLEDKFIVVSIELHNKLERRLSQKFTPNHNIACCFTGVSFHPK